MKNIKLIAAVLFLSTAFSLGSCSGDLEPIDPVLIPNPNPNPTPNTGLFRMDVDGVTYTAATTNVTIAGGFISITATRPQGDSFIAILEGAEAGVYDVNQNLVGYTPTDSQFGYFGNHPTDDTANTGQFTITNINTTTRTISGTFAFTGYWTNFGSAVVPKEFTNGVFTNLPYTTSDASNDTFSALVNQVDFNDTQIATAITNIGATELISVGATNAAGNKLTVTVRSNLSVGTYTVTGNAATDVVQIRYGLTENAAQGATAGTVTILEKTVNRIRGVFEGAVSMNGVTYNITAGSFDVAY